MAGTYTAALSVVEVILLSLQIMEQYNGSSWTELADLNLARYGVAATGSTPAALAFGGADGSNNNKNETESMEWKRLDRS